MFCQWSCLRQLSQSVQPSQEAVVGHAAMLSILSSGTVAVAVRLRSFTTRGQHERNVALPKHVNCDLCCLLPFIVAF